MTEQNIIQQQRAFMEACSQQRSRPNLELYISLIEEEAGKELAEAKYLYQSAGTDEEMKVAIEKLCDVAFDSIYVAAGLLNVILEEPMEFWNEGQRSNMDKVDPVTGKVVKNALGKVQKPEGWRPADFTSIIERNWSKIKEVLENHGK